MSRQFLIVLVFLGISAASWVFGKMKEKAEAEEAKKRATLHRQGLAEMQRKGGAVVTPQQRRPATAEQQAMLRKQQLAQLRQERLAALRAEMAARLQTATPQRPTPQQAQLAQQAQRSAQPTPRRPAPPSPPQAPQRPTARPMPSAQPRTNVATMRKPPSVSHDRSSLANLGTHSAHSQHTATSEGESIVHRLVTNAESTFVEGRPGLMSGIEKFTASDWRHAIILTELLAPPVSLRAQH